MSYIIVLTTCSGNDEAERVAATLIEKRLVACVQTSDIRSVYRWQGKVETANEVRLLIKARSADYQEIEAVIKSIHSYEVPQIIAIPVVEGSQSYLDWVDQETART